MGDQEEAGDAHVRATRSFEPMPADKVVKTLFPTVVAAGKAPASREATAETERPPPPPPLPDVDRLPTNVRFQSVRPIGRGGMGQVDEVFDALLGRAVAQKTMHLSGGAMEATLLVAEAQTAAQLEHPSIVPIYDFGPSASTGYPQYTMRLVRGRTLREVLESTDETASLGTLAQRLGVLRQVCLAVAYAHTRGVVHRDLKPENVICGEFGEVYVLDWGIAHLVEGSDVRRTQHDSVHAGSPGYMAPEQFLNGTIVPGTDVFSLGAILFEIVTGERAFIDRDFPSILKRCATGPDAPPSQRNPRVPRTFDDLVMRCLATIPHERPSARDVADAIDAFLDGERARVERQREAEVATSDGREAHAAFVSLSDEAQRLRERADALARAIPAWEDASKKEESWALMTRADGLRRDAALALARAQAAFVRALGCVPDHAAAREGLAALHYGLFTRASADGDESLAAQQLDLARGYDDGRLSLELANEGALVVEPSRANTTLGLARYERDGLRLVPGAERVLAAGRRVLLEAGSYLLTVRPSEGSPEVRYPLRIERAKLHRLRLRMPDARAVPDGMTFVPGGTFLAAEDPQRATTMVERVAMDFAMSTFPVTFAEYTRFLDAAGAARAVTGKTAHVAKDDAGRWGLTTYAAEGEARKRIPAGRELDMPAVDVTWYDAAAFAAWRAQEEGRALRLPTELEWERALRGADGRRFSMGDHLDPSFAKLRESRPESPQSEPVGAFPIDASPFGVRDLTGGVGDWLATMADGEPAPALGDEGTAAADARQAVWRGGCWSTTALFPHAMRFTAPLVRRYAWVGFRLCVSLDAEDATVWTVEPMRPT